MVVLFSPCMILNKSSSPLSYNGSQGVDVTVAQNALKLASNVSNG